MFNTLVVAPTRHTTEYVTREVHEHRAPTDESVRLLAEMEAAAQARVIEAIHVGDSSFDCVVQVQRNLYDNTTEFAAVFSLRGKKLTARTVENNDKLEPRSAIDHLITEIARLIALEIVRPALATMSFRSLGGKFAA